MAARAMYATFGGRIHPGQRDRCATQSDDAGLFNFDRFVALESSLRYPLNSPILLTRFFPSPLLGGRVMRIISSRMSCDNLRLESRKNAFPNAGGKRIYIIHSQALSRDRWVDDDFNHTRPHMERIRFQNRPTSTNGDRDDGRS